MSGNKDIVVGIRLTADGDQLVGEVKLSKKEMERFGDSVDRADRKTSKFSKTAQAAARNISLMAAAAAGTGALYSTKKTMEFEKAISDLSAITGATGDQLNYLANQSLAFGAATTLSATQSAEAFKLVASAKPDLLDNAAALSAVTREAIVLAEAAGISLPESARALGASLNQFNADADESTRYINVLAAGAKFGASEIFETSMALKESGTVAASANISFEQTNALIQMLAGNAIKGAQAGTALRGVILKLQNQANNEFNPAIVGITAALQNLKEANLTTAEKMKLFGLESITAAEILIRESDAADELTRKLTGTNTAYEQASIRTDNLAGDMKKLESVIEGVGLAFGKNLNPHLRDLIQAEAEGLDGLRMWLNVMGKSDDIVTLGIRIQETGNQLTRLQNLYTMKQNKKVDLLEWLTGTPTEERLLPDIAKLQKELDTLMARRKELMNLSGSGSSANDDTGNKPDKGSNLPPVTPGAELLGDARSLTEQMDEAFLDISDRTSQRYTEMYAKLVASGGAGTQELMNLTTAYSSWMDEHWTANDEVETARQTEKDERVISMQQAKFDRLAAMAEDAGATEEEREINRFNRQIEAMMEDEERLRESLGNRFNMEEEFRQAREDAEAVHQARMAKTEQSSMSAQAKLWQTGWSGKLSVMGSVLSGMASLMQSGSRKMFEIGKASAIAEATVTGAKAVLDAFAWGNDIGGPIMGGIAAAAAAIPVGVQIAKIASARFGGGGSVSAGGAAFSSGGSGQQSAPVTQSAGGANQQQNQSAGGQSNVTYKFEILNPDQISPESAQRMMDAFAPYHRDAVNRGMDQVPIAA